MQLNPFIIGKKYTIKCTLDEANLLLPLLINVGYTWHSGVKWTNTYKVIESDSYKENIIKPNCIHLHINTKYIITYSDSTCTFKSRIITFNEAVLKD